MIRDTLLVIDDSELDQAILNEIFKRLFCVECISDARQGMSFLHHNKERVCAILLDICLERRGAGFTVLHQIQGNPTTAALPVILITTDANENDVRASVERGAVDFLVKPVDPHTVQERICNIIREAWPPNSTILDCRPDPSSEQMIPSEPDKVRLFPQSLSAAQVRELCREWSRKLEAFSCFRPGLDMQAQRQLGTITALLARHYMEQFPHMDLTEETADMIGEAAVFCDIGLLGIPDQVVQEGEDQNGPNAQLYYQHTQLGRDFFTREGEDVPLLRYAAEIALWHHKNVDGSGYPLDADGTAIPISAQLTRTALRIQRYLHYYRGCADRVERMLRTLKSDVGVIISSEMYQAAEMCREDIQSMLQST